MNKLNKLILNGSEYIIEDHRISAGETQTRPTSLGKDDAGFTFFDTKLKKPIWWNGDTWVDASGNSVVNS